MDSKRYSYLQTEPSAAEMELINNLEKNVDTMHCINPGQRTLIKKENQNFLIYKEIQNGAVAKSYITNGLLIWRNISQFPHILGSLSSYMTLQLLHSEFP
jgi:hypothetical protein